MDTPLHNPTTLYRLYGPNDELLYIGVGGNPGRRFQEHRGDKPWWGEVARTTLEHFPTRQAALAAEAKAIRTLSPRYNIQHNRIAAGRPSQRRLEPPAPTLSPDIGPYPSTAPWVWRSLRSDFGHKSALALYWELNGASITDDFYPDEKDAYDLWRRWVAWLHEGGSWDHERGYGWVRIYWYVDGDNCFEFAPFQPPILRNGREEDFLTFFTWPQHEVTGEQINWARLPVTDLRWTPDQPDKGGFIQEATGWKPAYLQWSVYVPDIAAAGRLYWPQQP